MTLRKRIAASLFVLAAILFLPYWAYLPLLAVAMVLVPFYWEAIVFGFLIDVLYGSGGTLFSPAPLVTLLFLVILLPIRERIRWNL